MLLIRSAAVFLVAATCAAAQAKGPDDPAKPDANECAQVTASVRAEAYGYTHIVTLKNACDKPVACEVWTDVDPSPRKLLTAAPGESDFVVTRRGSPARAVEASKDCRFQ